ncbi:AAA family ATPase [Actinocrispum wychmicini]|uniref:Putative kinase n=1 Tax=Actinocrispum wychmicini TaxID=1213861 RepID=A0A4R2JCA1_9PSEU|nr:AAA family ATPase [Actinocrispum wychmicini]TCO57173.1 putative kinase [Actinocrispum wychmicini]
MITTPPNPTDAHSGAQPLAPKRRQLIATRGLPASGKSTWAREQLDADTDGHLVRCNRDDLRRMLHGRPRYDPVSEAVVTIAQRAMLAELLFRGYSVIIDDTNLDPDHLHALKHLAAAYDVGFAVQDFTHVAVEQCIDRDRKRPGDRRVGEAVIRRMHDQWLAHIREPS